MNKEYIVTDSRTFDEMIKKSKFKYNKHYTIYYKEASSCKFGIAVPKKTANAVHRNKTKRRLKEIIRRNDIFFKYNNEYIIITKKSVQELTYLEMEKSLIELFSNVNKEK